MTKEKNPLIAKLDELDHRFCEIEAQISDPEIATNHNKLIALSKEQGKLRAMVGKYREYKKAIEGIEDARQILADETVDADFKDLATEEISELEATTEPLLEDIRNTLVMADDDSINAVILEIRPGTGGDEASLFARDLYDMYVRYAESKRWKTEQLSFAATEMGGFREVILSIKGQGAWGDLGYEGGGHRVQRVPETESQGRVHTSAATGMSDNSLRRRHERSARRGDCGR